VGNLAVEGGAAGAGVASAAGGVAGAGAEVVVGTVAAGGAGDAFRAGAREAGATVGGAVAISGAGAAVIAAAGEAACVTGGGGAGGSCFPPQATARGTTRSTAATSRFGIVMAPSFMDLLIGTGRVRRDGSIDSSRDRDCCRTLTIAAGPRC
jgi:hypothetical protein